MLSQLKKIKVLLTCLIFSTSIISTQSIKTTIEIGFNPSDNQSWWVNKNNYGYDNYNNYQKTRIDFHKQKIDLTINLYSNLYKLNENILNESFIKYRISEDSYLKVGRYYRDFSSYLNDDLSSGSLLLSNNSNAMPKAGFVAKKRIGTDIFLDYGISHAIFDKNDVYTKAPFLHEKFIYLNFKKNSNTFKIGFVHEAMWGGTINNDNKFAGKQPQSFSDFLKIFISGDGPEDFPHSNALGNHIGIWDFVYQKSHGDKIFKSYYQHLFEDTSGLRFKNRTDGLWGLELTNYIYKTNILIEYINTKNQFIDPPYVSENYYSHGLYSYGWSYKDFILGNPLISPLSNNSNDYIYIGFESSLPKNFGIRINAFRILNRRDLIKNKIEVSKKMGNGFQLKAFYIKDNKKESGFKIYKSL